MPEPFRYQNKETLSGTGMLRYRTEMIDAGIPMLAASAFMPMPSYAVDAWSQKHLAALSTRSPSHVEKIE